MREKFGYKVYVNLEVQNALKYISKEMDINPTQYIQNLVNDHMEEIKNSRKELFSGIEGEIWKPAYGLEEFYEVSNIGRIRTLYKDRWHNILIPQLTCHGYHAVHLTGATGRSKRYLLHRLIAFTFLGYREEGFIVNHINSIRDDNRIENLEWVNYSQNAKHSYKFGNRKNNNGHFLPPGKGQKKLTLDIVKSIKKDLLIEPVHLGKIAKKYGVKGTTVSNIYYGKTWKKVTI